MLCQAPNLPGDRRSRWHCLCDCGNKAEVLGAHLRAKTRATVSCGCHNRSKNLTHGHSTRDHGQSSTYSTWAAMWRRCTNPKTARYDAYGGRGIRVCDRWRSFANFLADMGVKPTGLTLERDDSNVHYEPSNCRWATQIEQQRNRRNNKLKPDLVQEIHGRCEYGESHTAVAKRFGISRTMVYRIRHGLAWADQLQGPS